MPLASVNAPAYLIHNNIPVYQTYRNDWYEDPYHYHYSVVLYPENELVETFDIRDLPGYADNYSAAKIIRHAIDEKALPIFKLPEEQFRNYLMDETIGYVSMTPEQDACFELADYLLCRLMDASAHDGLCIPADQNVFHQTFFLVPERNPNNEQPGYRLSTYSGHASWEDFRKQEPSRSIWAETFYGESVFMAVCYAAGISYPFREERNVSSLISDKNKNEPLTCRIQQANEKQNTNSLFKPEVSSRFKEPNL